MTDTLMTPDALDSEVARSFARAWLKNGLPLDDVQRGIYVEDVLAFARQWHDVGFRGGGVWTLRASAELADVPQTLAQINNRLGKLLALLETAER